MCCDGFCKVLYGFGMDFGRILGVFGGAKWGGNQIILMCRFEQ